MGLFRRIGRVFRRVTRVVSGVANFAGGLLKKVGLDKVLKPFSKVMGILNKIPGLGPLISKVAPFLSKLGPLAFLAGGPIGIALGVMSKIGTVSSLANFAGNLVKGGGGLDKMLPQGLNNLAEGAAFRHAQLLKFF